jgi:hypothetical protein
MMMIMFPLPISGCRSVTHFSLDAVWMIEIVINGFVKMLDHFRNLSYSSAKKREYIILIFHH